MGKNQATRKRGCTQARSATTERGCGPMPIFQLLHRSSSRLLVACDLLISPGGVSPCRSISSRTASPRVPSLNLSQLGASSSEATDNGHPPLLVRGAAELDMRDERPSIDLSDLSLLEESSDPGSHQPPTLRRRSARIDLSRPAHLQRMVRVLSAPPQARAPVEPGSPPPDSKRHSDTDRALPARRLRHLSVCGPN